MDQPPESQFSSTPEGREWSPIAEGTVQHGVWIEPGLLRREDGWEPALRLRKDGKEEWNRFYHVHPEREAAKAAALRRARFVEVYNELGGPLGSGRGSGWIELHEEHYGEYRILVAAQNRPDEWRGYLEIRRRDRCWRAPHTRDDLALERLLASHVAWGKAIIDGQVEGTRLSF